MAEPVKGGVANGHSFPEKSDDIAGRGLGKDAKFGAAVTTDTAPVSPTGAEQHLQPSGLELKPSWSLSAPDTHCHVRRRSRPRRSDQIRVHRLRLSQAISTTCIRCCLSTRGYREDHSESVVWAPGQSRGAYLFCAMFAIVNGDVVKLRVVALIPYDLPPVHERS